MNRRQFIQSLAAAFALPATPALLKPAAAALPAAAPSAAASASAASAAAMATKARFWTIYMYGLHGNCTPATLSTMLNIPETQARGYLTNLVADGTIRPSALLRNTVTKVLKSEDDGVLEKVRERIEMKGEAEAEEDPDEGADAEVDEEAVDDVPEEAMAAEADEEVTVAAEDITDDAEVEESPGIVAEVVEGDKEQLEGEMEVISPLANTQPDMPDEKLSEQDERTDAEGGR